MRAFGLALGLVLLVGACAAPAKPPAAPAPVPTTWQPVTQFHGTGDRERLPFTVSEPVWRLRWQLDTGPGKPQALNVNVTDVATGRMLQAVSGLQGEATFSTGPGEYSLFVHSRGEWLLTVEEGAPDEPAT